MKCLNRFIVFIIFILSCIFYACEKKEVPAVITEEITEITGTTATCGGIITNEGSSPVIAKGACWSTEATPTIDNNKTSDGSGSAIFNSNITGLNGATTYYVRAYATNGEGTGYGANMSFTTFGDEPETSTQIATDITTTGATLNSIVNANYFSTVITFEYGTSTDYGQTATATQSPVTGSSNTNVSIGISGLSPGTTYHFRVKAENDLGTTYGNDMNFTTLGDLPIATTQHATNITTTGATLNGTVNANYLSTTVTFEYGTTMDYGSTIIATQSPITGNEDITVSAEVSVLEEGTYHYRIKAVNSLGTIFGDDMTFTTAVTTLRATYQGGIVFYIDNTGQHGLICAPEDQSSGIQWYNGSYLTTGAIGVEIGTGQENTSIIVTIQGDGNYAAKLCDDLVLNGYDDWFLPSIEELHLMYLNLKLSAIGNFADWWYWSSTEDNINNALDHAFHHDSQSFAVKYDTLPVRAVRAF